jgi:hypothetical protein
MNRIYLAQNFGALEVQEHGHQYLSRTFVLHHPMAECGRTREGEKE